MAQTWLAGLAGLAPHSRTVPRPSLAAVSGLADSRVGSLAGDFAATETLVPCAGCPRFTATAPGHLQADLVEFLQNESIFGDDMLFQALKTPESAAEPPFLVQRARAALNTGAYIFLRNAAASAGGIPAV